MIAVTLVVVISVWVVSFNKLLLAGLNSEMAASKQINVRFYKNLFSVLIAIIVTISLKWVGMLMINSLLVLPAASARNLARNMKSYHLMSVGFSFISGISGLLISYYIGTSAGSTIVLVSAMIFFVSYFMRKFR